MHTRRAFIRLTAAAAVAAIGSRAGAGDGGKGGRQPKGPVSPATDGEAIVAGEAGGMLDEVLAGLDASTGGFCGSAIVARRGEILLVKSYGLADAIEKLPIPTNAMWDWASIAKQFTATAVLVLEAQRRLSINDPIQKHFPDAPKDKAAVTLRQLLSHTSGIRAGFDPAEGQPDLSSREGFLRAFLALPMEHKPGSQFEYSNTAYIFLAALVEKLTRRTFEEFCAKEVYARAGVKDLTFIGARDLDLGRVPKDNRGNGVPFAYGNRLTWGYRGCGGVVASTRAMLAWDRALRGSKLLDEKVRSKLYEIVRNDYALGWEMRKDDDGRRAEHSGAVGQTVTYYLRHLDADAVIALAYSYRPAEHPAQTSERLLRIAVDARR